MNDNIRKPVDASAVATGIFLIGIGVLFFLDRLGFADFNHVVHNWWPMIVVALGVRKALGRNPWGGLWLIAIGTWLQLASLRVFGLTFNSSWPLLLIFLGAGMILRTVIESSRRREPPSPEEHRGA
jgi:hypothetical protein